VEQVQGGAHRGDEPASCRLLGERDAQQDSDPYRLRTLGSMSNKSVARVSSATSHQRCQ
jgi:hypothetical protein